VIQKQFHVHLLLAPDDDEKAQYYFDRIGWCTRKSWAWRCWMGTALFRTHDRGRV